MQDFNPITHKLEGTIVMDSETRAEGIATVNVELRSAWGSITFKGAPESKDQLRIAHDIVVSDGDRIVLTIEKPDSSSLDTHGKSP